MTGNLGFVQRTCAEIRIMDGEPIIAGTTNAPMAEFDDSNKANAVGRGFLSGEPMALITNSVGSTNKFTACSALSSTTGYRPIVCFSLNDYIIDSDGAVAVKADASGLLQGISCLAQNRIIATSFFNTNSTYKVGQPLTVVSVSGITLPVGNTPIGGYIVAPATASTDIIVGYVGPEGVLDTGTTYGSAGAVSLTGLPVSTQSVVSGINGSTTAQSYTDGGPFAWVNDSKTRKMLSFTLAWNPNISFS